MDPSQFWNGAGAYQINQSLRFDGSAYLNRTPASAGNRKTFTYSFWIKRAKFGAYQRVLGLYTGASFDGSLRVCNDTDSIGFESYVGSLQASIVTSSKYRDPSAWMHVVYSVDTTQATASDRVKIYVNGQQVTSFSTATYPSQNADLAFNNNSAHHIGQSGYPSEYLDAYLAEFNFIDGTALTPSSFGETDTITGAWIPKKYSGSYGTNGFYLKFSDNSGTTSTTLGKDSSGNGNNWTPNNFSVTAGAGNDSLTDTPTPYADGGNGRGNYCTANPLNSNASTLRNGNLEFIGDTGTSYAKGILGTMAVSSGKWYFEVTADSSGTYFIGVAPSTGSGIGNVDLEYINGAYSYRDNGDKLQGTGGSFTSSAYGNTYASPDVIGVALDLDNGAIYFAKNNTWQNSGVPTSGASKTGAAFTSFSGSYVPMACGFNGNTATLNFGARAFAYTPPTGFKALNTANLPEPTIKKGSAHFNTVLYTGTGSSLAVTGVGFQPDFIWFKNRSNTASHSLVNQVTDAYLASDLTDAESAATDLTYQSDGFTLTASSSRRNTSSQTYVAWNWKADNTNGSSNTAGTITSTVSANASAGFSIVSYTGTGANATVGHGLGVAPKFFFGRNRNDTSGTLDWIVYHESIGNTGRLKLNTTDSTSTSSTFFQNTSPSSTVITIGTSNDINKLNGTYIMYCFSEVAGYSKFGSYTGNGSSDGPFVFCGFRPRWIMVKTSSNAYGWAIHDTARQTYNEDERILQPNTSGAEATNSAWGVDILSNGFKWRNGGEVFNFSGYTYIFAAFAELPFKYANAR